MTEARGDKICNRRMVTDGEEREALRRVWQQEGEVFDGERVKNIIVDVKVGRRAAGGETFKHIECKLRVRDVYVEGMEVGARQDSSVAVFGECGVFFWRFG